MDDANAEVEEIYHYLSGNGKSGHTEGLNNVKDYAQKKAKTIKITQLQQSRKFDVPEFREQERNAEIDKNSFKKRNSLFVFEDLEGASCFDEIYNYIDNDNCTF